MVYEYRKLILFFSLTLFASEFNYNKAYCQTVVTGKDTLKSIIGRFISPKQENNKFTAEAITLSANSTFEYIISTEFTKIKVDGRWRLSGNKLILNSNVKREKISVEEKKSRSNKLKFDAAYKTNELLYYQLYLLTSKGTLHVRDVFGDTSINHTALKGFYIMDARGFQYPTYFLKNRQSNYFRIRLEKDRIFDNEVWQIKDRGNKLQPMGLNGKLMNYCLIKQ
jgi:hypothetical protein